MEKLKRVNLEVLSSFQVRIHIIWSFKNEASINNLKVQQRLLRMTLMLTKFSLANLNHILLQCTRRDLHLESSKKLYNWIQITYRGFGSTARMATVTQTIKTFQTTIRIQVFRTITPTKKELPQEVVWWECQTPRGHSSKRIRRVIIKW